MHPKRENSAAKQSGKRFGDSKASSNLRATSPGNGPPSVNLGHHSFEEGSVEDHAALLNRISQLEADLERRQTSYVGRERTFKQQIDELEEELANQRREKTGWMKTDSKMQWLKSMKDQILKNVEQVQDRTAKILQEQERDLLRAFRARLFDVQTELEKERSKKDDGAGAWIERSRQLEAEVDWAKEVADRLERHNQSLALENGRLKSQFNSQEEDRNFIIKQLVAVKKDNAKLRAEYSAVEEENSSLKNQLETLQQQVRDGALASSTTAKTLTENEEKLKELYNRTRRMLAEERKALQTVRLNYANELKARTEMELMLRQAVEDVRKEISRKRIENNQFNIAAASSANNAPQEEFSQEDRERVLELLLSQERVVTLLYAKTFPMAATSNNTLSAGTTGRVGSPTLSSSVAAQLTARAALLAGELELTNGSPDAVDRPQTAGAAVNAVLNLSVEPGASEKTSKLPSLTPHRPGTGSKK